ncbi:MAG: hypothetical protein AAFX85_16925, partial [Pseudomonadota bacterium]
SLFFTVSTLDISADGNRLYLVPEPGSSVIVYDLTLGAVVANIDLADDGQDVLESIEGNFLYAIDDSATLSYIDADLLTVRGTAATQPLPRAINQDPVSDLLYVVDEGRARLQTFTPNTGRSGPSAPIGNLSRALGQFIGPTIEPHVAGVVDNAAALRSYVCTNISTGQRVGTQVGGQARRWDCTALGLITSPGDFVDVVLIVESD